MKGSSIELKLGQTLWDYHKLDQNIVKSDLIIGLGGHDTRVAERCVELFKEDYAPIILFTGGVGRWRVDVTKKESLSEAERFARVAEKLGVERKNMILEKDSTNTGENISFTRKILEQNEITHEKAILVNQPYMERRTFATFKKQWSELNFIVTSPQSSFENYPKGEITMHKLINKMVSDLQRILIYPEKGYQITQNVPENVMEAYSELISLGFTEGLLKE